MRAQGLRRAVAAAFVMSMAAVGSLTAGVQADAPWALTFEAQRGSCIDGQSNYHINLTLYDSHDTPIDSLPDVAPDSSDHFHACFATGILKSGRSIHATNVSDLAIKEFAFPSMSVQTDRVTDVVKGTTVINSHVTIRVKHCPVTGPCGSVLTRTVSTDHQGKFRKDLTSAFLLRGGDAVGVTWTSAEGNTWSRYQSAPFMTISAGSGFVSGILNSGQHATFRLRSHPGGSVLSTRGATGATSDGHYVLEFSHHSSPGRQVGADFASDARLTVPSTTTSFPIENGDQKIRGHCLPNRTAHITWTGPHGSGFNRTANGQGQFTVNLSSAESDGFRLDHGSGVRVICASAAGDAVVRDVVVP